MKKTFLMLAAILTFCGTGARAPDSRYGAQIGLRYETREF